MTAQRMPFPVTDMCFFTAALFCICSIAHAEIPENVASTEKGGNCDGLPVWDSDNLDTTSCAGAIDGIASTMVVARSWAVKGNPLSTKLTNIFSRYYLISKARFMPLSTPSQRTFKDVKLEFEYGAPINFKLTQIDGSVDYVWEELIIDPPRYAKKVTMSCVSTYWSGTPTEAINGLIEVEYHGIIPPADYTPPTTTTEAATTTTSTSTTTSSATSKTGTQSSGSIKTAGNLGNFLLLTILFISLKVF